MPTDDSTGSLSANPLTTVDANWAWQRYEPKAEAPWDLPRAAHLLRRAGFAPTWKQLEEAVRTGCGPTIDRLLEGDPGSEATSYPDFALAQKLKHVAQLIDAGLSTRIYYVSLDGFDTHANQAAAHAALVNQLSASVAAFVDDLAARGQLDRVLVLSFSEFGRRVHENASQGTDHGTAAPVFLIGGRVAAGVLGAHPSLTDLDGEGDLKFHTDFRRLYATILDGWLGCPSQAVLASAFEPLPLFKT